MSLTLHLLLFSQSNVSIYCNGVQVPTPNEREIYLIENQDDDMLGLFCYLK